MGSMIVRTLLPLTALLCGGLVACSQRELHHPRPMPAQQQIWCQEVMQQLNDYRRKQGLRALKEHEGLRRLSLSHCDWLLQNQGSSFKVGTHVSHFGSHWRQQTARRQHGMEAWAENVAYTAQIPRDVAHHLLLLWKTSPSHQPLLVGDWSHAGMALRVDESSSIFATLTVGRLKHQPTKP